jgi:predicted phage terminase large subunit-like protein
VIASPETGAKLTRAMPVAAQAEAGNLAVLRARWNGDFIEELRDFPLGRKDDQVDALSRAFAMLLDRSPPARRLALPLMIR